MEGRLRGVRLTGDRAVMGDDANSRLTTTLAWSVTTLIIVLNATLICLIAR
jgi:manganese transport protein